MDRLQLLQNTIRQAGRLRAAGPTTMDYLRWRDATDELLASLVGSEHPLRLQFRDAVGPFDPLDAEGLQIDGPRGMHACIDRGEQVLRALIGEPA